MDYDSVQKAIDDIEAELKRLDWWQEQRPPEEMFDFKMAFGMDTMPFSFWLQFVLIPRVKDIIESRGEFPNSSNLGTHAVREYDGVYEADDLVRMLTAFDRLIESL
ncbi:MAG TPA: YqcC family protein [Chloroflexia bacterium]|jgi:uncharacterized protein YqcC (DUF446 family)